MKIVCLGDSLTYGYGVRRAKIWTALLSHVRPGLEIQNKGINGDTTNGMLARLETDVLKEKPDLVIIMGGSNDIFFSRSILGAQNNICAMYWQCVHEGIKVVLGIPFPVVEGGLAPEWKNYAQGPEVQRLLDEYRQWLLEFGRNFQVLVLDFWQCILANTEEKGEMYLDGIHLTPLGHEVVADYAAKILFDIQEVRKFTSEVNETIDEKKMECYNGFTSKVNERKNPDAY